jgi:hypothetical protein
MIDVKTCFAQPLSREQEKKIKAFWWTDLYSMLNSYFPVLSTEATAIISPFKVNEHGRIVGLHVGGLWELCEYLELEYPYFVVKAHERKLVKEAYDCGFTWNEKMISWSHERGDEDDKEPRANIAKQFDREVKRIDRLTKTIAVQFLCCANLSESQRLRLRSLWGALTMERSLAVETLHGFTFNW